MKPTMRKLTACLLIAAMSGAALPPPAAAGLVATDAIAAVSARDSLAAALARADVRARLEAAGVRPQDIQARVDALTDDEVAQLAERLNSLPAGGDGIVGAIVLVFLVLLITDILGYTKVFPFTRPAR
jgi:Skp family chaperone for outer membrane proteins